MTIFEGTRGLSYLQVAAVFAAIASVSLASSAIKAPSYARALAAIFTSARGLVALSLMAFATIAMTWPAMGRPDSLTVALCFATSVFGVAFCAVR